MKQIKLNGFQKLVCFSLAAILCVALLGFAVGGLQTDNSKLPNDSGNVSDTTDKTDENKGESTEPPQNNDNNDSNVNTPPPEEEVQTEYINNLTGFKISREEYNSTPLAAVIDPKSALYGVSSIDLAIEFPIENGSTRMLCYSSNRNSLWKIGALMPTRDFISDMSVFFGGIVVSYGNDDVVIYDAWETDAFLLDVSRYNSCYYIENTLYVYTSEALINSAKEKSGLSTATLPYNTAPYEFLNEGYFVGTSSATTVTLPYSNGNETELYYHEKSGEYLYYKAGNRKVDMLTGKNLTFKNIFILFADTTTYERSDGTETVVDVRSGGKGYYISEGRFCEFRWQTDNTGKLSFVSLDGEPLLVNIGNGYIAYYKSTSEAKITIR